MVEMHAHVIWGVDDGPKTPDAMFQLLRQAAGAGADHLICTSHITPGYARFPREAYLGHFQQARDWCAANAPDLTLHTGSEILYTESAGRLLEEGAVPTLDGTRAVLVEFLPESSLSAIRGALEDLGSRGYQVILAHVERYVHLQSLKTLRDLKETCGCLCQMNSRTVWDARENLLRRHHIRRLLDGDLVDFVSSDAHSPDRRPVSLDRAYEALRQKSGPEKAAALCGGNIARLLRWGET